MAIIDRPHWALKPLSGGYLVTPVDVYIQGETIQIPRWQGWAKAAKAKIEELEQAINA